MRPGGSSSGHRLRFRRQAVALFLAVAVWAGLLYGVYYYATDYINGSLRRVQETNALHVQALNERLDAIQYELDSLKEALGDTDQMLTKSDETREALHRRIETLDRQLERLEQSLNVLRMSPDAPR